MDEAMNMEMQENAMDGELRGEAAGDSCSQEETSDNAMPNESPAPEGAEAEHTSETDLKEDALRAHFDGLRRQANELRRSMPMFDLERELRNPDFFRWTSPQVGMPLREAYMAAHGEEMLQDAMRYAVERTLSNLNARVRAAQARPREGGLTQGAAASVGIDIKNMTPRDRAELRARVARGERVVL